MNKQRRDLLSKAIELLIDATNIVERVTDEERDSLDNLPENLQSGDRAEKMEDAIDKLGEASEYISDAADLIDETKKL